MQSCLYKKRMLSEKTLEAFFFFATELFHSFSIHFHKDWQHLISYLLAAKGSFFMLGTRIEQYFMYNIQPANRIQIRRFIS